MRSACVPARHHRYIEVKFRYDRCCELQRRHGGIADDFPIDANRGCTRLFNARLNRRISADRRATKVVLLTASYRELLAAFARGAKGVLLKGATPPELFDCIRHVAAGGHWLPSDLIDATLERDSRRSASQHRFESLTKREQQIIMTVSDGLSNKDIG